MTLSRPISLPIFTPRYPSKYLGLLLEQKPSQLGTPRGLQAKGQLPSRRHPQGAQQKVAQSLKCRAGFGISGAEAKSKENRRDGLQHAHREGWRARTEFREKDTPKQQRPALCLLEIHMLGSCFVLPKHSLIHAPGIPHSCQALEQATFTNQCHRESTGYSWSYR